MSLISFRNFTIPLQNRMQLGAIIVVVLLVAVMRLSSGPHDDAASTRNSNRNDQAVPADGDINAKISSFLETRNSGGAVAGNRQQGNGDALLNGIMNDDRSRKQTPPAKQSSSKGLDDIKRSLGLE